MSPKTRRRLTILRTLCGVDHTRAHTNATRCDVTRFRKLIIVIVMIVVCVRVSCDHAFVRRWPREMLSSANSSSPDAAKPTHTHPCINVETIIKAVLCLDTEREGTRERERDTAIVKCRDVCLYDGTRAARRKYPPRRHSRVDQRPDNISAHMHIGRKMGVSLAEYRTICDAAAISVFAFWRPLCTWTVAVFFVYVHTL